MSKNGFKRMVAFVVLVGFFGISTITLAKNANAAVGGIYQKLAATSLITCYQTNQFINPRQKSDFKKSDISNLMSGSQKVWDSTGTVSVKCSNFVKDLLADKGVSIPGPTTSDTAFETFMTNMGYNKGNSTGTGKCVSFDYSAAGYNGKLSTPKLCASSITNMGNGVVNSAIEIVDSNSVNKKLIIYTYNQKNGKLTIKCPTKVCGTVDIVKGSTAWSDVETAVKQAVLSGRNSARISIGGKYYDFGLDGLGDGSAMKVSPYGEVTAEYNVSANDDSLKRATGYLVGTQYGSKPIFLGNEHFVLYQNYLLDFYGGNNDVHCNWDSEDQKTAYVKDYHRPVKLYQNGTMKTCYINTKKMSNKNKKVGGVDGSGIFGMDCNLECVLSWLDANTINYTGLESMGIINPVDTESPNPADPAPTPSPTPGEGGTKADFDCDTIIKENGGKLGSMQWILCPSLNNTAYTANWIDNLTQDMLQVKTDRYDTNSGTYKGWELMRNIANVVMTIFLLIIIFSQITGYGIDNYGIKKMLPRLIVMALVINLSFYICELVIDLSNIAGVGFRDMFGAFGESIGDGATGAGTGYATGSLVGIFTAFATGSGPAIAAGTAAASLGWVAIVIAAIVLVLVVIVAVVILWLMLGLREIIIIACVILSPLAFVAFVLPNTQNLSKKWWSLFKAAIIVYPICGAVAGISYMLKGVGGSDGMGMGVAGKIILFVLPYLVFFLLPILLKNALTALGKLGGALTSLGNNIRNGGRAIGQSAMRTAQNTQRYKDMQAEASRRNRLRNADRVMQRFGDGKDLERRLADAQARANTNPNDASAQRDLQMAQRDQRRFYAAQQEHYQLEAEQQVAGTNPEVLATRAASRQEALELKNYSDQFSTLTRSDMATELIESVNDYLYSGRSDAAATRLQAAIQAAESRGMSKEMLSSLSGLELSTMNGKNDSKILGQMAASNNKVISQYGKQMGKLSADKPDDNVEMSMSQFAATGMKTKNGDEISLSRAFANQGSNVLNNMDDDTLDYIRNYGRNAASTDALLNAAVSTTNQKELHQINEMLKSADSNTINFSGKQLANFDKSTVDELYNRAKTDSVLQQKFVTAYNDITKSPELMATLKPEQRDKIVAITGIANGPNT